MKIVRRPQLNTLTVAQYPQVLTDLLQKRAVHTVADLTLDLAGLLAPKTLLNIDHAAQLIIDALEGDQSILVVGDYDVDGATAIAVALRALRAFGCRRVDYLVPNRMLDGYGLTAPLVTRIIPNAPDLLITVDNGISSIEGIALAKAHGIKTLVTDHHLPPNCLPDADAIVNPNLVGDSFESKMLSGVGVIFYVLLQVRSKLLASGYFAAGQAPNLAQYLDLVALGTVADVVPLDANNRRLVQQGLLRIRQDCTIPGIRALAKVSQKTCRALCASDIGFGLAPLLNAAGRLDDMALGIECLLTDSDAQALSYAEHLHTLNQERRAIERTMVCEADEIMRTLSVNTAALPLALILYDDSWHQGVMGIVASRLKETFFRPVLIFADDEAGFIKGSGRSIKGIHLRDAIERVASQSPQLIQTFGGHAMAAGLRLKKTHLAEFTQRFNAVLEEYVSEETFSQVRYSDGALDRQYYTPEIAMLLKKAMPWGQGFPEPTFDAVFEVVSHRILKEAHVKLCLRLSGTDFLVDGIAFFKAELWTQVFDKIHCLFKLDVNEWRGKRSLQLLIEHFSPNLPE